MTWWTSTASILWAEGYKGFDPEPFDFVRTWHSSNPFFFNYQMIDHNLMIDHNFDDDWWLITMFLNFRIFVCLWMLNAPVQLVKPAGFGHTDQGLCSLDPRHLWMSKNFLKINGSRPGKDHQNRWGHGVLFCKLRGIKNIYPSKRWQCNVRNMAIYSRFWHILTIYGGNLVNSW